MVCLITGSAGLIGSSLCHWIINNTDHKVIGIDNLSGGFMENMPPVSERFLFYQIDIVKEPEWTKAIFVRHKPEVTFHMGCYAAEGRSNYIRSFNHLNNTVGSANIINHCLNNNSKLIFTSSVAVYSGEPPFNEGTLPNPIDSYGVSKYTTEMDIRIAGEQQGLDWCIIRPRNVYGTRQSLFDPARNLWGIWCYQALNNQPITIFGDGRNTRSFTFIDDILEPLYNAISVSKQIINLGSERFYSIKQAADIFREVTGYDKVEYLEPRHEQQQCYCDVEKSKQLLGFKDQTSIYNGVKQMWAWAKKQQMRPKQIPPPLEVFKTNHSTIV